MDIALSSNGELLTAEGFADELASQKYLDEMLAKTGLFRIYPEVVGEYIQPRLLAERKEARIDRLCIPTKKLLDAGWRHGPLGIEAKRSGQKVGPVVAQATDYSRVLWHFQPGFHVAVEWIFIWPMHKPYGAAESVMVNNRIGYAYSWNEKHFRLSAGPLTAIEWQEPDIVRVNFLPMGNKTGSR